jgi:hypothetical protein
MDKTKKNIWLIFDMVIVCFFIILILLGWIGENNSRFGALFGFSIGIFFLTCEKMKDRLYFSRMLSWISKNILKPRTKINHIFAGCLFIIIDTLAILMPSPISLAEKNFYDEVKSSYEFWIGITLVLFFNILVGVYTAKRTKAEKKVEKKEQD